MILKNKIAMITGAARGIGYETAKTLLQEGATVFICDIVEGRLNEAIKLLKSFGPIKGKVIDV